MTAHRKQRLRVGDVLAIALPAIDRVAFARVYQEGTIAVYADLCRPGEAPPLGLRRFLFQVGVYAPVLSSGVWPRVAHDPFATGEDPQPVPRYVQDALGGGFEIHHRGSQRPATRREVEGLEPVAAWDRQHVEDRIVAAFRGERSPWLAAPWPVPPLDLAPHATH
jgi:hypothetical protein